MLLGWLLPVALQQHALQLWRTACADGDVRTSLNQGCFRNVNMPCEGLSGGVECCDATSLVLNFLWQWVIE